MVFHYEQALYQVYAPFTFAIYNDCEPVSMLLFDIKQVDNGANFVPQLLLGITEVISKGSQRCHFQ